ncbi:hypothetical protein [Micromonospora tarensis]|uniref:Uncharacterized protein n=1 Tax=Micromonospora tarensis TaxID=2806100 RepID=A0ABS1YD42_9ACTN|nr:hypothetical protein [Micromonospora tarensis]MBM0275277.1 hypothetical protein [Micromonospora tarensis]
MTIGRARGDEAAPAGGIEDWREDAVPYVAYGLVAAATLERLNRGRRR